jgi:hypothetical protein
MIAHDGAINVLCAEIIIRMMIGVHIIERKDIEKEKVAFIPGCAMNMGDYIQNLVLILPF